MYIFFAEALQTNNYKGGKDRANIGCDHACPWYGL